MDVLIYLTFGFRDGTETEFPPDYMTRFRRHALIMFDFKKDIPAKKIDQAVENVVALLSRRNLVTSYTFTSEL